MSYTVAYLVFQSDNYDFFYTDEQRNALKRCLKCGLFFEHNFNNPLYKISTRKYDISSTHDFLVVVSERFLQIYNNEGFTGLEFQSLPKSPGFYVIQAKDILKLDIAATVPRIGEKCSTCNRFNIGTGSKLFITNDVPPSPYGFYRTDIETSGVFMKFGDPSIKTTIPNLIVGIKAMQLIKDNKIKGISFHPVYCNNPQFPVDDSPKTKHKPEGIEIKKNHNINLEELIQSTGLVHISKNIEQYDNTMLRLLLKIGSEEEIILGRSKFGGSPDLPPGMDWPTWQEGRPLSFIVQLNLADAAKNDKEELLPKTGMLYFFYDVEEERWGIEAEDKESWRVIYYGGDLVKLTRRNAPENLDPDYIYEGAGLDFEPQYSLPTADSIHITNLNLNSMEQQQYQQLREKLAELYGGDEIIHKLLGHPDPVQNDDMQEYCARFAGGNLEEWRLLLQIDSGDATGMVWGDEGRLYFWIREQDLKAREFGRVWMVLQCG